MVVPHKILMNESLECLSCESSDLEAKVDEVKVECLSCGREYPDYEEKTIGSRSKNAVFGYGSLILPTSLVSRFTDVDQPLSKLYSKEDKNYAYIRGEALINYDELDLELIPCKLYGYKREYSISSDRGRKMLDCTYTGNSEDFVNGVIIKGLSKEQLNDITSTEEGYTLEEISSSDFEFYNLEESKEYPVSVYVSRDDISGSFDKRNRIYHNRIKAGIKILGSIYNRDTMLDFYNDFEDSFDW